MEGRKNGRNVRRVVTGGRRPVDDTFPAGRPLGASLPLGRGQYCGRGPLVTRYMATKDMDRRAASEQLAFVTRTIDDTNRHGIRANYDSPWAHLCPGIDDEPPPCLRRTCRNAWARICRSCWNFIEARRRWGGRGN